MSKLQSKTRIRLERGVALTLAVAKNPVLSLHVVRDFIVVQRKLKQLAREEISLTDILEHFPRVSSSLNGARANTMSHIAQQMIAFLYPHRPCLRLGILRFWWMRAIGDSPVFRLWAMNVERDEEGKCVKPYFHAMATVDGTDASDLCEESSSSRILFRYPRMTRQATLNRPVGTSST